MFQTKFVEKTKKKLCEIIPPENRAVYDNVEDCGRTRQATDDSIIRRMLFACWITKATDTHSSYVITYLLFSNDNNGDTNAFHCYVYEYTACLVKP